MHNKIFINIPLFNVNKCVHYPLYMLCALYAHVTKIMHRNIQMHYLLIFSVSIIFLAKVI